MEQSCERELKRVLRHGETLIWCACVSVESIKKSANNSRLGGFILSGVLFVFTLMSGRSAYKKIVAPGGSILLGVLSAIFALLCIYGVYHLFSLSGKSEQMFPYTAYGVTEERLIALNTEGVIGDEIHKDEIEDAVWLNESAKDDYLLLERMMKKVRALFG